MPSFDGSTDDGSEEASLETDVGVVTSFGFAFVGDYDVDAVAASAESFDAVDSREDFEIFEAGADDGDDYGFSLSEGLTFAASSEAVLVPFPETGDDASGGSGTDNGTDGSNELVDPEMAAAFDDIDRVAADATAYASSLEPTDESELVAHVALGYESADDAPSESEVEDVFGDTSGEFSMEAGERHVYISSTYSL